MTRTAIWRTIAATLQAEIERGQYGRGAKLPTEAELARRFGVNRHTVRHALGDLAEGGLVYARRGAGVFVTDAPRTEYPLGRRVRFAQNITATGRSPSRQTLRLESRSADDREAAALGLSPGDPVHVYEGLSLADGTPIAMFRSVFPAERFPGLPDALSASGSVTGALAVAGVGDYTRSSTTVTAKTATGPLCLHLRLREGAPVLRTVAVNIDPEGRPIEHGTTWFAGDRVALTVMPDPTDAPSHN